ncbi:MAG: hypothetical protein JNJ58_02760 [Chitinophagaceae bacterium]|nr:hypothetical protein [Chitinophagaceae bacterium]
MKTYFILFLLMMVHAGVLAQETFTPPRFVKKPVGNSGCFAYLPDDQTPKNFDISYSPDSSKLYTGDFSSGEFHYSLIVVKLKEKISGTRTEMEDLLIAYLDYLQTSFNITNTTGYGKGHILKDAPDAIGVLDYWEDSEDDSWVVKGWTNGSIMAVMMVYGPREYPNQNALDLFLNGFRFK